MKSLLALLKKEIIEHIRTGKLLILSLIFILLGIMNPAVAKLTPWFLEIFASSLEGSGIIVTEITVSAMDSWVQFFKNIPIGLIVFVFLQSNIFTKEYQSGTLILTLTKGIERFKIVISKGVMLFALWSALYWLCFGITYAYNAYFWDNGIAQNLVFSVVCWWLFGMWIISLLILFSSLASSNTVVLAMSGGVALVSYLLGVIPKFNKFLPTMLTDSNSLIYGSSESEGYISALAVAIIVTLICFFASIPLFNKKQL